MPGQPTQFARKSLSPLSMEPSMLRVFSIYGSVWKTLNSHKIKIIEAVHIKIHIALVSQVLFFFCETALDDGSVTGTSFSWNNLLNSSSYFESMIEPLLLGIVLGLVPITLLGLFVAAWNQYRRSGSMGGWQSIRHCSHKFFFLVQSMDQGFQGVLRWNVHKSLENFF